MNTSFFVTRFARRRNGSVPIDVDAKIDAFTTYKSTYPTLPSAFDVTDSWAESGDYDCFEAYLLSAPGIACDGPSVVTKPNSPAAVTNGVDLAAGTKIGAITYANFTNIAGSTSPLFTVIYNASANFAAVGLSTLFYDR